MVEATVTLKKGGTLAILCENWEDLAKILEGQEIIHINGNVVGCAPIHPRKHPGARARPIGLDLDAKAETCICCGEAVPEGRQICPSCETQTKGGGAE